MDSDRSQLETVLLTSFERKSTHVLDTVIEDISHLLDKLGEHLSSQSPRLYYALRMIHRIDLLPTFQKYHVNDLWLPIPILTLEEIIPEDPQVIDSFSDAQMLLLSDNCNIQCAQHCAIPEVRKIAAKWQKKLGTGGYGRVDAFFDSKTGIRYARKTMSREPRLEQQQRLMKVIQNEINVMRRVQHRHCVEYVSSFADSNQAVLFSIPVADMDLAYLLDLESLTLSQVIFLRKSIGCLSHALLYLHNQDIRHDDIKPNNILIHGSNILFTDFGNSLDFSSALSSTTSGSPSHRAYRYCAPEILEHRNRNRATDVWSLGCVFVEIISRLRNQNLSRLIEFWLSKGNNRNSFADNPRANELWFNYLGRKHAEYLQSTGQNQHHPPRASQYGSDRKEFSFLRFVYASMLHPDRLWRPSTEQLVQKIEDFGSLYPGSSIDDWVGQCCSGKLSLSLLTPQLTDPIFRNDSAIAQWPTAILDTNLQQYYFFLQQRTLFKEVEQVFVSSFDVIKIVDVALSMAQRLSLSQPGADLLHLTEPNADELNSCICTAALKNTLFYVDHFNLQLHGEKLPRLRTVEISLRGVCFQRSDFYRSPLVGVIFDPDEGNLNVASIEPWVNGLRTESVSRQKLEARQKLYLEKLNTQRFIIKGLKTAQCDRCVLDHQECSGPDVLGCLRCRALNIPSGMCVFDKGRIERGGQPEGRYIDNKVYWSSEAERRWNS